MMALPSVPRPTTENRTIRAVTCPEPQNQSQQHYQYQYQYQHRTPAATMPRRAHAWSPRPVVSPLTRSSSSYSSASAFSTNSSRSNDSHDYTSDEPDEAVTPPLEQPFDLVPIVPVATVVPVVKRKPVSVSAAAAAPPIKTAFSEVIEDTWVYDQSIYDHPNEDEEIYDYDENGHRIHRHLHFHFHGHSHHAHAGNPQRVTKTDRLRSLFHRKTVE